MQSAFYYVDDDEYVHRFRNGQEYVRMKLENIVTVEVFRNEFGLPYLVAKTNLKKTKTGFMPEPNIKKAYWAAISFMRNALTEEEKAEIKSAKKAEKKRAFDDIMLYRFVVLFNTLSPEARKALEQ